MKIKIEHIPVMPKEVIKFLNIKKNGVYVDGTLGSGGHCQMIAQFLNKKGKIIGIDQDIEAIKFAKKKLAAFKNSIKYVNDNFVNFESILDKLKIKKVDGVLLDLGVSSHHLENPERGFSFRESKENLDSEIDMRMNQSQSLSAYDVLNKYQEDELKNILFNFGEEPYAGQIAKKIVQIRKKHPIVTINDLLSVIKLATPPKYRFSRKYGYYASKVFRGIRMEVNQELLVLQKVIPQIVNRLKKGGRLIIISFHSLEDRIVKQSFREMASAKIVKLPFKKPLTPSKKEIIKNPKASSAKLRVFIKYN